MSLAVWRVGLMRYAWPAGESNQNKTTEYYHKRWYGNKIRLKKVKTKLALLLVFEFKMVFLPRREKIVLKNVAFLHLLNQF